MYAVSEEYLIAMKQPVQRFRMTGKIGNQPFVDDNILQGSFSITNQCSDSNEVQIGQVFIGELSVTFLRNMNLPRYSLKDRVIRPVYGLRLSDGTYEDVPLGVFTVSEAQWSASGVNIKAYDNMKKLDRACNINSAIGLPFTLATMACDYCNLELATTEYEFSRFANGSEILSMMTENDIETWRDFLSWVAQTCGCNAMADREGRIIFKAYSQEVVDTVDDSHRFSGGQYSDFVTRYTGLSCVNIAEKTTTYYGLEVDDGLTYNLGSNPFLQYGVDEAQAGQRRAVLTALQQIEYVPFELSMIGSPVYDLMDVFSFPGGLGDDEKLFCMTKFEFNYHGQYKMVGVGKNPALANAKSKTDKNLEGLMSEQADEGMHYTVFTNADPLTVADGESKSVMFIRFIAQKKTHVTIEMELLPLVETTEEGKDYEWIENDAVCHVTYYLNGEAVEQHIPVETWQDGRRVLALRYDLQAVAAQIHTWDVWLEMEGGKVDFEKYAILGVVSGVGLAGESEWDGNIYASDDIHPIHFYPMFRKMTETVSFKGNIPLAAKPSDTVGLNFLKMFRGFVESAQQTADVMVFTPYVNQDKVITACSHNSTVGWIGDGTTALGTALDVVTAEMTGVTHVETRSSNAIYYASFDGGDWVGWTATGWVAGASMVKDELEAVPASAWAYGEKVRIQAVLETDASMFTLDVYGGKVETNDD